MDLISIVQSILVLIIVVLLANLLLKFINRYMFKHSRMIKIIDRLSVNSTSSMCIVRIVDKYYLMSFSNNDNSILKELDKEKIEEYIEENTDQNSINYKSFSLDNFKAIKEKTQDYFGVGKKSE